jgi:thiamine kinase-like enzyme
LRRALEQVLAQQHAARFPIVGLERRASAYRSSFRLEEIRVAFGDGTALDLIFKDVSFQSLSEAARRARPEFLHDPLREIEAYSFVARESLGTACLYGAVVDVLSERYWLLLEHVTGDELYKIGDFSTWEYAARWLADMHLRFASQSQSWAEPRPARWLKYDAQYYRRWMQRAQRLSHSHWGIHSADARRGFLRLAERYEQVVVRLASLPVTWIHGEFYASNILIGRHSGGLRVCAVDWEMAAMGPGLVDLAALVSGNWNDDERTALALSYLGRLQESGCGAPPTDLFLNALDDCRLHLAVQWLGWSGDWTPPAAHRHDWLHEALHLAEKVGCI